MLTLFKQMQVAAFQSMDTAPVVFIQAEGSDGVIHYLPAEALSIMIERNENLKDTNNKDVLSQLANDTNSGWQ